MRRKMGMLLVFCLLLGCGQGDTKETDVLENTDTTEQAHAVESTVTLTEGKYSDEKLDDSWDESNAFKVLLCGDTISADDESIQIEGSTATITKEGTYILSGELTDGQIIVDNEEKGDIKLVLNGAAINCSTSAPIYIESGNVVITLAEGTENIIEDSRQEETEDEDSQTQKAAIYAKDDLTFNGTGTLTLHGSLDHGIQSKDALKFVDGTYVITSAGDSIVGKDSVSVKNGNFTIEAGGDGIKATNVEETDQGYVIIENGEFHITAEYDGIQAETLLRINGGTFDMVTGGGSENAVPQSGDMPGKFREENGIDTENMVEEEENSETESSSTKGLKSYVELVVAGGNFTIDSCDDALHSNQDILLEEGTFTIDCGDDGVHAESSLTINGGNIDIRKSYEGLEGYDIIINGGDMKIISSDDGINAAGDSSSTDNDNFKTEGEEAEAMPSRPEGEEAEAMPSRPEGEESETMPSRPEGEESETMPSRPDEEKMGMAPSEMERPGNPGGGGNGMEEDTGAVLTINGGSVYVNAEGDALDANGDIFINGGTLMLQGPTNGGNGTFDYAAECKITGGTLLAVGSVGMAQSPGEDSDQPVIVQSLEQKKEAGTVLMVKDSTGAVLGELTAEKSFQWYAISTPELRQGETYTVSLDNEEKEVTIESILTEIQ